MILVIDCGSTKADWVVLRQGKADQMISSKGFNPVVHPIDLLEGELIKVREALATNIQPSHIFYYGAGCWDDRRKRLIVDALKVHWPKSELTITHDLLGAARASCGHQPGIACILGTGSNTCLYDGHKIIDNVTNLGFILGDEGSGSYLGKAFLRAYFYRELDDKLKKSFEAYSGVKRSELLDAVYEQAAPNTYLASFTKFMGQHKEHPLIKEIILGSFGDFLDCHVRKYAGHLELPINFIGSIAFHFQDILLEALKARNMRVGQFIAKPVEALAEYHRSEL